ncbi:MAG: nucleotide exchange factor GrpE [Syntrophobacteraceae bacterium]|nr:nucleotide exchange factor GrpE [Syntrophobacteraceae bacterium]
MALGKIKWFQRKKEEKEKDQALVLEEIQSIRKLLRKQSVLIEEVRREQEAAAAEKERPANSALELCDSVFYLHRAFRHPGFMSRQHAQVLNMVMKKAELFAASLGMEMILDEGVSFDPGRHEAVENRSPGSDRLDVLELVQPGYLQNGKVIRPARVIVCAAGDLTTSEGIPSL